MILQNTINSNHTAKYDRTQKCLTGPHDVHSKKCLKCRIDLLCPQTLIYGKNCNLDRYHIINFRRKANKINASALLCYDFLW